MHYRKFQADYLFTGTDLLGATSILITNDKGEVIDIVDQEQAGEGIEVLPGIISPGFVNAHCHIELSHLKNKIAEKTGLVNFVYKVVTERHYPEEEILHAITNAVKEMRENGIVAVGDICNNELSISEKNKGLLRYYNFIEVSGWNPSVASERFQRSQAIYQKYIGNEKNSSMVPHAPYSISSSLWEKITPYFAGKIVTIHNQETKHEDEFFLHGTGDLIQMYKLMGIDNSFYQFPFVSSLQSYYKKLSSASSVILVHNTFIKQEDVDYIFDNNHSSQFVSFCLCPNANIYIEDALPPVHMLIDNHVNIVVGTDSLASNHRLDILEELKAISKKHPDITTEVMLTWATLNGAKALQMENLLGSFGKGKQPGIILIENVAGEKFTTDSKAKRIL